MYNPVLCYPGRSTGPNRVGFTWWRGKNRPLKRSVLKNIRTMDEVQITVQC
jgi:hypothetical protein